MLSGVRERNHSIPNRIACAWLSCAAKCQSSMRHAESGAGVGRCPRIPSASFRLPWSAFWCTSISWPSGSSGSSCTTAASVDHAGGPWNPNSATNRGFQSA
ncbi:hypothetical protein P9139_11645 [Curtobacterium flaccumfaciens]|nr:hypothetical protein P9139_11645 [Curtobacterium flaccumfaciens]